MIACVNSWPAAAVLIACVVALAVFGWAWITYERDDDA